MSLLDRFGDHEPEAIRTMVLHAYERSQGVPYDVQFEALADVGELHKAFPHLERIAKRAVVLPPRMPLFGRR